MFSPYGVVLSFCLIFGSSPLRQKLLHRKSKSVNGKFIFHALYQPSHPHKNFPRSLQKFPSQSTQNFLVVHAELSRSPRGAFSKRTQSFLHAHGEFYKINLQRC